MGKPNQKKSTKLARTSINGEVYEATVFKVVGRDDDGSPRTFEILRDDEKTKIEGGEEFWVVFAKLGMAKRRN